MSLQPTNKQTPHTAAPPPDPSSILAALQRGEPAWWNGPRTLDDAGNATSGITPHGIQNARDRFRHFAPLLAELFPEAADVGGVIESPLLPVPALQAALGLPPASGALFVKADHLLPIAGSIKARGGIHEVLEFAEGIAQQGGLLREDDYQRLAGPTARALFADYQVAVGSTGNLGLSIGTMASALGFRATVHMSSDAKEWKKARLRQQGVEVVEHAGDYAKAVAAGRDAAAKDPSCHFVDDEHSHSLFFGYAASAYHLATQLRAADRRVDATHPLFVYLPCGVGGAPGGIAYGLQQVFGDAVHCFFAEPTHAPCFMLAMLGRDRTLPGLPVHPSVYEIGLDNQTEADGLAVPRASALVADTVYPFIGGTYTVADDTLFHLLAMAKNSENLRIEPSAAAGFDGPNRLLNSPGSHAYLETHRLEHCLADATHLVWTTGGRFVPDDEYDRFLRRGLEVGIVEP